MFLEILLAIALGVASGIFTGLIPGIHINLVSLIVLSVSAFLLKLVSPLTIAVFIIAMSVNHTFIDSIPGIFLGAPDEAQALNVLPGHRMLMQGEGYNAVKLTVIGSFTSLVMCVLAVPLILPLVKVIYPIIKEWIGHILIVVMIYLVFKDNKRVFNLFIFFLSASLGLIVLNYPNLKDPLFPMLSGLFGFSILIPSILQNSIIPKQKKKELELDLKVPLKASAGATVVGFMASFLPGFGSSQAAIIATQVMRNLGDKGFMILVGGINTVNMTLSLVTLHVLEKARNGSVIAVSKIIGELGFMQLLVLFSTALVAGGMAVMLSLNIAKVFSKVISKVNYKKLVLTILGMISILVFFFSGFVGILVLIVSTAVGLTASELGVGKNHCLACLILPVILFFVL